MSGSKEGGKKAAATNKKRYGADFYKEMGRKGGQNSHNGGFASLKKGKDGLTGPERAAKVGAIGGLLSRRGPTKKDGETKKKPASKPKPTPKAPVAEKEEEKPGLIKRLFRGKNG